MRVVFEQCCCRHDLSGLAVTTLWYVEFTPCILQRMFLLCVETFDCRNARCTDRGHRRATRTCGNAVQMHCACGALTNAATEFRASGLEGIAEYPEQRRVRFHFDCAGLPVHVEGVFAHG